MHQLPHIANLILAADQVLGQVQNGELFLSGEPYMSANTAVLDELEIAVDAARPAKESPFVTYRTEILGMYGTAYKLQKLVLHLYNMRNKFSLGELLWGSDEHHTRIALDLISSYAVNGENDRDFMALAEEISDRNTK